MDEHHGIPTTRNTGLTSPNLFRCMSYESRATVAGSTLRWEWALKEDEARRSSSAPSSMASTLRHGQRYSLDGEVITGTLQEFARREESHDESLGSDAPGQTGVSRASIPRNRREPEATRTDYVDLSRSSLDGATRSKSDGGAPRRRPHGKARIWCVVHARLAIRQARMWLRSTVGRVSCRCRTTTTSSTREEREICPSAATGVGLIRGVRSREVTWRARRDEGTKRRRRPVRQDALFVDAEATSECSPRSTSWRRRATCLTLRLPWPGCSR